MTFEMLLLAEVSRSRRWDERRSKRPFWWRIGNGVLRLNLPVCLLWRISDGPVAIRNYKLKTFIYGKVLAKKRSNPKHRAANPLLIVSSRSYIVLPLLIYIPKYEITEANIVCFDNKLGEYSTERIQGVTVTIQVKPKGSIKLLVIIPTITNYVCCKKVCHL